MKTLRLSLFFVLAVMLGFLIATGGNLSATLFDGTGGWAPDGTGIKTEAGITHVTVGNPISQTGVEYPLFRGVDDDGDVLVIGVAYCSVLTDGAEVCEMRIYTTYGDPGTLTLADTFQGAAP